MSIRKLSLLALALTSSCAATDLERFEYEAPRMGTSFRIVLYASDRAAAERAARDALERVAELNALLSDYDPESELSRLSDAAGGPPQEVSPELYEVLELAQGLARESDGAFDVTVGPVARLWRRARRTDVLPVTEELARAAALVGHRLLELDPDGRTARLRTPGMRLDLGGIAKGYAGDEALRVLSSHGIERALVDAGGDVVVGRAPPNRRGWRLELAALGDAPPARLELERGAVATSGDLERFLLVDGVRYSHLVDPRTGRALTRRTLSSVVVLGGERTGTRADALASAVSVLGAQRGMSLVDARPGVEARVVVLDEGAASVFDSGGLARALSSGAETVSQTPP